MVDSYEKVMNRYKKTVIIVSLLISVCVSLAFNAAVYYLTYGWPVFGQSVGLSPTGSATVKIVKNCIGSTDQNFYVVYYSNSNGVGFLLKCGEEKTIEVVPGSFDLVEYLAIGWQGEISCDRALPFNIWNGGLVTCNILNQRNGKPLIKITKVCRPEVKPGNYTDWDFYVSVFPTDDPDGSNAREWGYMGCGRSFIFEGSPGSYSINETIYQSSYDWRFAGIVCNNGATSANSFNVAEAEEVKCSIINRTRDYPESALDLEFPGLYNR